MFFLICNQMYLQIVDLSRKFYQHVNINILINMKIHSVKLFLLETGFLETRDRMATSIFSTSALTSLRNSLSNL